MEHYWELKIKGECRFGGFEAYLSENGERIFIRAPAFNGKQPRLVLKRHQPAGNADPGFMQWLVMMEPVIKTLSWCSNKNVANNDEDQWLNQPQPISKGS